MKECVTCGVTPVVDAEKYSPSLIGYPEAKGFSWHCPFCVVKSSVPDDDRYSLTQAGVRLIAAEDAAEDNYQFWVEARA